MGSAHSYRPSGSFRLQGSPPRRKATLCCIPRRVAAGGWLSHHRGVEPLWVGVVQVMAAVSTFAAAVCVAASLAAWHYARPTTITHLVERQDLVENHLARAAEQQTALARQATSDLEAAERERDTAQTYNRRSAARDNAGKTQREAADAGLAEIGARRRSRFGT